MFNLTRSLDRNADRTPHEDAVIFCDMRLTHRQLPDEVVEPHARGWGSMLDRLAVAAAAGLPN